MAEEQVGVELRAQLERFDKGEDIDKPAAADTKETKEPAGKPVGEEPAQKPPKPDPKPDAEKGSLPKAKPDSAKAKPDEAAKSKFAKERERRDRTWAEINAEKEAVKAEREATKQERERWERERQEQETKLKATATDAERDGHGYTVADYERAAKQFREEGDAEMASKAENAAKQLREQSTESQRKSKEGAFLKEWRDNLAKAEEKEPELKDQKSELYKEVLAAINGWPELAGRPDGVLKALEAVKVQRRAAKSDEHEATAKKLKAELESLQEKLSVGGGTPEEKLAEEKPFERLSLEDQRKRLRAEFGRFDSERGNG